MIRKKILKQHIRNGYPAVCLYNGKLNKKCTASVHRLVAYAFVSGYEKSKVINHINGDKLDNRSENLEWVTYLENTHHAIKTALFTPHPKSVEQYSLDNEYIATYSSILDASHATGANDRHISCVCRGKRKTCGGYIWKYANEEYSPILDVQGIEVPDYPNYIITKDMRVYSKRLKAFLKPVVRNNGYMSVKLCNDGKMHDEYVHKLYRKLYD